MGERPACAEAVTASRISAGWWPQRTISSYLADAAARQPDKTLIVDRFGRLSYAETLTQSETIAANLGRLGVKPGDRVAVQLPNWRHFPLVEYALARLGAVIVALPPIYRHRELKLMLSLAEPVAAIVPSVFRQFDHAAMFLELAAGLPSLRHLVVVGEPVPPPAVPFARLLKPCPAVLPPPPDPNAVTQIAFTSGTTGEPKGVMHTANTNLCPVLSLIADQALGGDEVILMASTFGHQTGFSYGGQMPIVLGGTVVLMDRWDADEAAALIGREKVSWVMGATPFLQDLTDAVERGGGDPLSLRTFLCSGAAIPRPLLARAQSILGAKVVCGWGMTEVGLATLSRLDDPAEKIFGSDGRPLRGMAVRVVDDAGQPVPDGVEGELQCQGPSLFAGYWRRPELTAASFADGGWLRTGDRARRDADGYIRITGRSKDIIVRGGENIPVVEVEDLLHKHPLIQSVAIVAIPDPRLQERACAVVVPRPGVEFAMSDLVAFLDAERLARQYFPERLVIMEALPMTPSGKVQKFLLRQRVLEILGLRDVA